MNVRTCNDSRDQTPVVIATASCMNTMLFQVRDERFCEPFAFMYTHINLLSVEDINLEFNFRRPTCSLSLLPCLNGMTLFCLATPSLLPRGEFATHTSLTSQLLKSCLAHSHCVSGVLLVPACKNHRSHFCGFSRAVSLLLALLTKRTEFYFDPSCAISRPAFADDPSAFESNRGMNDQILKRSS
jgi:hypothetical protein